MYHSFKSIGEVFSRNSTFSGLKKLIDDGEVVEKFYDVFPQFTKIAEPIKVDKKTLHLKIENAAWRNELKFQEEKIIEEINNFFGEKRISRLKVTI